MILHNTYRSRVLLRDGADKDSITIEELQIDRIGVGIFWVVKEHRVQTWSAGHILLEDGGVDVVEQHVAHANTVSCGAGDDWPSVEFLVDAANFGVVAEEGREGSESGPSSAESRSGVAAEAADIGAYDGYLVERRKLELLADRDAVPEPAGDVVYRRCESKFFSNGYLQNLPPSQ